MNALSPQYPDAYRTASAPDGWSSRRQDAEAELGETLDRAAKLHERLDTAAMAIDARLYDLRIVQRNGSMLWSDTREARELERRLTAVLAILEMPL